MNFQMQVTISNVASHNYHTPSSTKHLEDSCHAAQLQSHETNSTFTTQEHARKKEATSSGQHQLSF
jgi:hypothetical protein